MNRLDTKSGCEISWNSIWLHGRSSSPSYCFYSIARGINQPRRDKLTKREACNGSLLDTDLGHSNRVRLEEADLCHDIAVKVCNRLRPGGAV